MRLILATLALPCLAGPAAADELRSERAANHAEAPSPFAAKFLLDGPSRPANCRDRIEMVRQERGLAPLRRENAGPGEIDELMFHAVVRRVDGCDVLVMVGDPQDIRPLPPPRPGGWQLLPGQ